MQMLVKKAILALLLLYCLHHARASIENSTIGLARDYFLRIGARVVRIFTCSNYDKVRLAKSLHSAGLWLVFGRSDAPAFPPFDPFADWERSTLKADYYKFGVFLDYDCSSDQQIFIESSNSRYVNSNHFWLIWSKEKNFSEAENAALSVDSELTWAHPGEDNMVELHDLYKINFTWPLIATSIGTWDTFGGLVYNLTDFKYRIRQNLQHLIFDTAVAVYHEDMEVDDIHRHLMDHTETNFTTLMTQCSYSIILILKDKFNFTITLHMTRTSSFDPLPNGYFDGQIGMMQRNEATLSTSPLLYLPLRQKACTFLSPTWKFDSAAIFRHPKVTGGQNALLAPFTFTVWMCTVGTWLLVFVSLKMVVWYESKYSRKEDNRILEASWSTSALATVAAVTEQGTELEASFLSWRIIFLFTLIQVVLLNNYYGGGVVSTLLTAPPKTIRTIKNLLDSNLKIGYENVSHNEGLFEAALDPLVQQLYQKKIFPSTQNSPNRYRVDIGIAKMKNEPFVFQVEQIQAYPYIEKTFTDSQKCALTEIPLFSSEMGPVYTLAPKRSAYKEILQYGYQVLWESGLMKYKWLEWRPRKPQCLGTGDVVSVEISTIYFAFLIFVCGILAAVIIFSIEWIEYNYRGSLKSNMRKMKIFKHKYNLHHQQRPPIQNEKLYSSKETYGFYSRDYLP